ncbi:Protein F45E4.11 [Aphelenchoides avenae]|nr:Protein F45E4.11 [Aphelenchus avenae]
MHTPGVQTALLQLAPAYTGLLYGIAFGCVAIVSIGNKIMTSYIIEFDSVPAWTLVFEISAVVAFLPVVFFTIWGSADRQPWASQKQSTTAVRDSEVMLDFWSDVIKNATRAATSQHCHKAYNIRDKSRHRQKPTESHS